MGRLLQPYWFHALAVTLLLAFAPSCNAYIVAHVCDDGPTSRLSLVRFLHPS